MKKLLVCTAISALLLSGCTFSNNKEAIIKVNDIVITKAEFDKAIDSEIDNSMFKNFGGADNFVKSDDNFMYTIFKNKVVNELIVKALLDKEIANRGFEKVTNDEVKAEMQSIIDKVGSKEELANILKQRGVSNSEFTEDLKTQIRIKKLINSIEKIKISDNDAEKYYKSHINEFKHGEQIQASHILISADTLQIIRDIKSKNKDISTLDLNKQVEETIKAQKVKADKVLAEVKANPDKFAEIAKKVSDDKASGERGGELGYFSAEQMVPQFSKAAFAMKPNTISETVIQSPYGYHIIKVTDRVEAGTTPFVKVKDEIKFYLETQKQMEILKSLTDGLMKNAKIEYVDESYKPAKDIVKQVKTENKK